MCPFVVKSSTLKVIFNTVAGLSSYMNQNLTHATCLVLFLNILLPAFVKSVYIIKNNKNQLLNDGLK